jgi:hypothetical protein
MQLQVLRSAQDDNMMVYSYSRALMPRAFILR